MALIDNILVYSKSDEEHAKYLKVVLLIRKNNKLCVKFHKCELWLRYISFLGNVISSGGIVVNLSIVYAILSGKHLSR